MKALKTQPCEVKIAFLIPDTIERNRFAMLFRTCMEAQGFAFKQFLDYDTAMAWLSDWP